MDNRGGRNVLRPYITDNACNVPTNIIVCRWVVTLIGIFVFAAVITPPDAVSQLMLGIPMTLLMEFSILVSSLVYKEKKKEELEETNENIVSE